MQIEQRPNKLEAATASIEFKLNQNLIKSTYLVGTDLNSQTALISTLVSCTLTIVHLGVTAPLKSVREGIEVVSSSYVLASGYTLATLVAGVFAGHTLGNGWSGNSTSSAFVCLEITSGSWGRG